MVTLGHVDFRTFGYWCTTSTMLREHAARSPHINIDAPIRLTRHRARIIWTAGIVTRCGLLTLCPFFFRRHGDLPPTARRVWPFYRYTSGILRRRLVEPPETPVATLNCAYSVCCACLISPRVFDVAARVRCRASVADAARQSASASWK